MEQKLKDKLDLMIKRMTGKSKQDNVILIDGDEGLGKSNMAAGICYYISQETGRPFSTNNCFFDLDKLINFAINNKEQIIWWDEGALGGLASDWWTKNQKKFMKLLMVARKRKHFFVICIPKFFKLNEYFVVDRSIALIHTYARKQIILGRFVYFDKKTKEYLYYYWKRKRTREYKKYYKFHGSFPEVLGLVINEEEYEKKKDEAILSIDKEQEHKTPESIIREYRQQILKRLAEQNTKINKSQLAKVIGVTRKTIGKDLKEVSNEKVSIVSSIGRKNHD